MRRLFPAPLLSTSLFVLWLVLNPPLDAGQAILGAIVALVLPAIAAPLRPLRVRLRRPGAIVQLILVVGVDVLRSNLDVARGILRRRARSPQGSFVRVPLGSVVPKLRPSTTMVSPFST